MLKKNKIKIGFIFFDELHIIPHFLGSAAALYNDPACEVDILTYENEHEYLYSLLDQLNIDKSIVKQLPTYIYKKIAYKIQGRKKPSNSYIIKKHKQQITSYDILVFNVLNHVNFTRESREKQKFVMLMHGAGDREYPFTEIHKEPISQFDLITTAGQKINDLFHNMGEFEFTKFEICGYQKLDVVKKTNEKKSFFDNDKPVVLFIPHFLEKISSYHKFGTGLLEYFYNNKNYNLIFAPHFNLFKRGKDKKMKKKINEKYKNASNIHVDLGSINSVNMTYTLLADIYIGDVSSQVYEFLLSKPKPCIFINAHNFDWIDDKHFQNWNLGKVISEISNLDEILEKRVIWQKKYQKKQEKAIAYTFDISKEITASKRVANSIKNLIIN